MHNKFWPDLVATFFGAGKIPKAPGTWGTLASLPLAYGLWLMGPYVYMVATVLLIILAIVAADQYGKGQDLKEIVIDETVGLLVACFLLPAEPLCWLAAFLLFRFFDILKPFPISHFDKNVKGGFGVVLDDLVAGLFANAILHFAIIKYLF